jgi:SMODS domain-containing protein
VARSVEQGFSAFLGRLTPSDTERAKASSHRASIYAKLNDRFGVYRMFESGSFKHGTGVSGYSDVDYFVSLKSDRPGLSSSTLAAVRDALRARFPNTYVHVSRPAVVLEFGQGYERVEVIPAYAKARLTDGNMKFRIPGVLEEWMESTPETHLDYVNACNSKAGVEGGAKQLARLAKAWKYYRDVPISSFYLEMRAAAYMATQSSIIYPLDMSYFLNSLQRLELAAMNDPTGSTGRIRPCSSDANLAIARSRLDTAVTRASKAVQLNNDGKTAAAFEQWDLLFNGQFPAFS